MTKLSSKHAIIIALLAMGIAGCATNTDRYPSLAIRDFERVQGTFEVAGEEEAFEPPAQISDASAREVARIVSQARNAHQSFMAIVPEAEREIFAARSTVPEDNEWAGGQLAYAELDTKRSEIAILLGDLDLIFADASLSYQEVAKVEEARAEVRKFVAEADMILSRMSATSK